MKSKRAAIAVGTTGLVAVLSLSACGSGDGNADVGQINNVPASSGTAAESSAAPGTSDTPTDSASGPVASPSRVSLSERGDDLASALSDSMNGSLGPAGKDALVKRLDQDGLDVSLDASVGKLYERTTHSKLDVVSTTGKPTVKSQGKAVTVSIPVVEGTAMYKPGEDEIDGGDRASKRLRAYAEQKPAPKDVKPKTFTFRMTTNNDKGTLSFEEKK